MVRTTIDAMQGNRLVIHQHRSIAGHNLFRFTRARLYGLLVLLVCLLGSIQGLGQINENIQSWTNRVSYGSYTQAITAGTVNMTQCIVSNAASATGTCSAGRVQMNASTGIVQLPSLPSVGEVEVHLAAGAAGRTLKLQYDNSGTWTDLTTWSGIGTTGATFTYTYNSPSPVVLRLASPSAALYVHDIIISLYSVSYTVTFDANNGSGTMSNQTANTSTALTSNTYTRSGYTFKGWNTAANGSGTAYANGASYAFTANATLYAQWCANQSITGLATSDAKTYGDADYTLSPATASSGLTITYTSSNTAVATISGNTVTIKGAGTTTITASQTGDATYCSASNATQTLTVNKKALTITGVSGTNKVYDGTTTATLNGTTTLNGVLATDAANVTLNAPSSISFASANVGTGIAITTNYTISGSASGNYSLTQPSPLTANITTRPLTIAANNASKTYGSTYAIGAGQTSFTSTGLAGSETIGSITLASTGAAATATPGTYAITPSAATGGSFNVSNYSITYTDGTLTINKANTSVTVTGSTSYINNGFPQGPSTSTLTTAGSGNAPSGAVVYTYTGTGATTYGPSTTAPSADGTYSVTASYGGDGNYNSATSAAFSFSIISNSITTTVTNYGPYCNSSSNSFSVSFSSVGTFPGNFYVQISDAFGAFPSNSTGNIISAASATSPINATIPANYTIGTGYRIRVVNDNPATQSSNDNGSNITINSLPTALAISSAPSPVCQGSSYSYVASATGAASYIWNYSGSNTTITNSTSATATLNYSASATGGTVSVAAVNGACTTSTASAAITINTAPANPVFTATTSTNNLSTPLVGGNTFTYSISPVAGASTYNWSVAGLTGWTITSGAGTTSITVTVGTGSGNVIVYASNACGNSSGTVSFAVTPAYGTYYSQNSGNPATLSNWNTIRGGGGLAPGSITAGNFVIQNGHNMASTSTITIGQSGTTFQIENGGTLTANNPVTIGGTMQVDNGGTYTHNVNGGTIPTATWGATSLCKVTGMTSSTPSGIGQSFGNFTWSCGGQTGFFNINNSSFSTSGLMTVTNTGSSNLAFAGASGSTFNYSIGSLSVTGGILNGCYSSAISNITVLGSVSVSGGEFNAEENTGTTTLSIGGNLDISGGSFTLIDNGSAPSITVTVIGKTTISVDGALILEYVGSASGVAILQTTDFEATSAASTYGAIVDFGNGTVSGNELRIKGDFTKSGTGVFTTSSASAANGFVFNKAGTQNFSYSGTASSWTQYVVNSGSTLLLNSGLAIGTSSSNPASKFTVNGTLNVSTHVISGGATNTSFILSSGATFITANGTGVAGSITTVGTQTFSSSSNYEFRGAATGIFTTTPTALTVNNLTINRAAGVTVNQVFTVNGTLFLTSGVAINGTNTIISSTGSISGAGSANYVNGQLQMPFSSGNLNRTYPIGDATAYAPVTINFNSVTTAGGVIANTSNTAQANFSTAQIDQAKYVKRTWTLTNNGTAFSNFNATFNFVAADVQGGGNTANFWGAWYNNFWSYPAVGTKTSTSTQLTALTGFGDFMVGEVPTNTITTGTIATSLCTGTNYTVPYTSTGTFTGGTFFAQLSDASGVFPSIGSGYISNSANSGINPLPVTIPSTYSAGSGYRIRILYSKTGAHVYGSNNGSNISLAVAPAFTADPVNTSVPANSLNAYFSVTATGTISTYQWQFYNGSVWADVPASSPYTGTTSSTLTIDGPNITIAMNGYQYRCIITGTGACTNPVTSLAATLSVATAPCLSQMFTGYTGAASFNNWTNSGGGFYNSSTSSGNSVNSYQFQATGNVLTSASLAGTGNVAGSLSFWLKSSLTNAASSLLVEGFNGITWSTIATINNTDVAPYTTGTTLTYTAGVGGWPANAGYIQFRFTYTKSSGNLAFDDALIYCTTGCSSPDAVAFVTQPSNVVQSATMNPVVVKVYCSSTGILANNYNGVVTIKAPGGANGCGLNGTTGYSATAVNGIATFSNLVFSRSAQTGIYIVASAASVPGTANSNTFNVTIPTGAANTTLIAAQDFDSYNTWGYSAGSPTYTNSGSGTDVVAIKTFAGNKALVKSFSIDNGSGEKSSTNTITFNDYSWTSATYDYATFKFTVGSLGAADNCVSNCTTGAGADAGDDLIVETSIDGGTSWNKLLTINGYSNYLFPFAMTPVTSLNYNANVTYSNTNTLSTFQVRLPGSVNQFRFRFTATNNRTNENWAIDSITLIGTKLPPGTPSLLPVVTSNSISNCPNTAKTLSVSVANTIGAINYLWTPASYISNTTVSNPTVNPPSSSNYSVTITDADNCVGTGTVSVNIPSGAAGNWAGTVSEDWFNCLNWGNGVVPDNTIDVSITSAAVNLANIDPLSTYASAFSYVASSKNITITNKTLSFESNAVLNSAGNLLIQTNGVVDMTNGGIINVFGNWTNSVGSAGLTEGIGTVAMISTNSTQLINTTGGEVFNNLTINNLNTGVTLNKDVLVSGQLTLTNGIVTTAASPNGLLTLGTTAPAVAGSPGTAAYINGPLAKQFAVGANTEFLYPLGKPLGYPTAYNPCYVVPANITGATTTFTSEYFAGPNEAQGVMGGSVLGITNKEYWNINKSPSNTSTARVRLYYDNPGSANWIYYTGDAVWPFYTNATPPCWYCNVAVVHKEVNTWNFTKTSNFNATDPEYKYYATDGWIYSKAIDNFSPFTLAYSYNMILPVKLLAFTGRLMNADGLLEWSIADARDLDGFELEFSTDGSSYQSLARIGSNGSVRYSFLHKKLPAGTNYYRLLVKEKGGNQYYSQVVMLNMGKLKTYVIGLAPTVVGTQLTAAIFAANAQKLQARITDVLGRQLWTGSKNLAAGTNQWNIDTHDLPKGLYFISLETRDGLKETLRFIKE